MTSEDIDRSYGNSPYFFYNHYPEAKTINSMSEVVLTETEKKCRENDLEYPSA